MTTPGAQRGHASRLLMGTYGLTPDQNLVAFLAPGKYQWTPPQGVNAIRVQYVGGGGGGGSGRCDIAGTQRGGGAGGAGGASGDITIVMHSDVTLGQRHQPWMLEVYAGGDGGVSATTAANGNPGGSGGDVYIRLPKPRRSVSVGFYDLAVNAVAGGGAGGQATGTLTGPLGGTGQIAGGAGAPQTIPGGSGTSPSTLGVFGATGGGSGGGVSTANVAGSGGNGGIYTFVGTGCGVSPLPGGGNTNNTASSDGIPGIPSPCSWGVGGGGGKGDGGKGGDGILGSGGGAGGGGLTVAGGGVGSGPGGKGGDGAILLTLMW